MFKRRLRRWVLGLLILVLALAVAFGAGALWLCFPSDAITLGNYKRISIGMAQQDVHIVLGPPLKLDKKRPAFRLASSQQEGGWLPQDVSQAWFGDSAIIDVKYDVTGHVIFKSFIRAEPADSKFAVLTSICTRIRDFLEW